MEKTLQLMVEHIFYATCHFEFTLNSVNLELQSLAAQILGKEAALFVPSGTMSNLIALLTHCQLRGSEAIVGDESHILHYEQTGAAQVRLRYQIL